MSALPRTDERGRPAEVPRLVMRSDHRPAAFRVSAAFRAGAAIVLALSLLGGAPGRVAAADPVPPTLGDLTFYGRGYGHGVGMSQYGALGRARAGQTAAAILAHYYAGTTLGHRDPATIVRVLVLTGFTATAAKPATITGRG